MDCMDCRIPNGLLVVRKANDGHQRSRGIQVSNLSIASTITMLSVLADQQSLSKIPTTVAICFHFLVYTRLQHASNSNPALVARNESL
jgi:hypothetical protein